MLAHGPVKGGLGRGAIYVRCPDHAVEGGSELLSGLGPLAVLGYSIPERQLVGLAQLGQVSACEGPIEGWRIPVVPCALAHKVPQCGGDRERQDGLQ